MRKFWGVVVLSVVSACSSGPAELSVEDDAFPVGVEVSTDSQNTWARVESERVPGSASGSLFLMADADGNEWVGVTSETPAPFAVSYRINRKELDPKINAFIDDNHGNVATLAWGDRGEFVRVRLR